MTRQILFDPLVPIPFIAGAAVLVLLTVLVLYWKGLRGWALRGLFALVVLTVVMNPSLQQEERDFLSDIVLVAVDKTGSQTLGIRQTQTEDALRHLRDQVAARDNTILREVEITDSVDDQGTLAMQALAEAMANVPSDRLAGVFIISDGLVHDLERAPEVPAPLHLLQSGLATDVDRRLTLLNLPPFAILDEAVKLTLQVDDMGAASPSAQAAEVSVSINGGEEQVFPVQVGRPVDLSLTLPHGGVNTLQFTTPELEGELTTRNNSVIAQINGVRDRLRVLLVSGSPHPGERTWRNLLKSDSSVDLVHFTILRPPRKSDGVPVSELSLIAFPTRELFLEKIDEFDLIIFDRYRRRGILPSIYLRNVRNYIEQGGAVLFAAGPDFATAESLYRSDLQDVIPASPTSRLIERGFYPEISEVGQRHPLTAGLDASRPVTSDGSSNDHAWGRWLRQIELIAKPQTQTVMNGADGGPLLVLNRVGEGRVALLASDQSWLWSRGFEGGGPQLELLRRLAHWMMKEPELEEEALWAEASGHTMTIIRRSLSEMVGDVTIQTPEGAQITVPLNEVAPGRFEAELTMDDTGLYRLSHGDLTSVVALGPPLPREFADTIATGDVLAPVIDKTAGGVARIEDGMPTIRNARAGRQAWGRGWLGLTQREAYVTTDVTLTPILPVWAFLILASAAVVLGWLREGRA